MANRLRGKVALITGAGSAGGIGAATAQLFCAEGAKIAVADLSLKAVEAVAAAICAAVPGAEVLAIEADIAREEQGARAVAATVARYGRLTTLVNNAGVREYTALAESDAASWQRIVGVNLLGTALLCKNALPELRKCKGAAIVNLSSVFGVAGRAGMGQYDATKAGISSLTRTLACEEIAHGVRVNAVCPGGTLTGYHVGRYAEQGVGVEELRGARRPRNPMQRWAEPIEIAYPILWLASDEASFITGTDLMVDGGSSI